MRRVTFAILSTVAALVMLLSFKTQSSATTATGSSTAGSASNAASTTVTGSAIDTRYGPVQVRIAVVSGKVTAVTAITYPQSNPRDQQINSSAIPQLNAEATTAKNAQIDSVSGATYTSAGYISSLQSALTKAGI
jgi:uncharacterized protein with FMN-binding domain